MKRLIVAASLLASVLAPMGTALAAPADPINLAFGTEPTQSSTHQGAVATRAVDSNNHGEFGHGSVARGQETVPCGHSTTQKTWLARWPDHRFSLAQRAS